MPIGGGKFELEKTWRSSGVGTQTFNAPGNFTMNYGKQSLYVSGTGGTGAGGNPANYNTVPGNPATYNAVPGNAATYNTTPGNPNYNTVPGTPNYNTTPGNPNYNTVPGNPNYNTVPGNPNYNTVPGTPNYNTVPGNPNYNTVPGNSYTNPAQNLYYYQSTEVDSSYVYVNYSPSNNPNASLNPYTQYFNSQYYADHQPGVLYPYAPWPQQLVGTYTDYNSYNGQVGYAVVVFNIDRPFQYGVAGNPATNPTTYPYDSTNPTNYPYVSTNPTTYPYVSTNPTTYPYATTNPTTYAPATYNPATYPYASTNPTTYAPATYNPATYPTATTNPTTYPYASTNPATYPYDTTNPTTYAPATYNPAAYPTATTNPTTYPVASYNPFVAGNPSSALGVTMPGGIGGGTPVTPTGPTEVSYYAYPDNTSYPVTVAPGGQVTIKSN